MAPNKIDSNNTTLTVSALKKSATISGIQVSMAFAFVSALHMLGGNQEQQSPTKTDEAGGVISTLLGPDTAHASGGIAAEKKLEECVDLVEINHFYDDQGRLVFEQVIYRDWCNKTNRYQVRDWRLLKSPSQIPRRNWAEKGGYTSQWHDFKHKDVLRTVKAGQVRETWTQYDPEILEREFLEQEQRTELKKVGPKPCPLPLPALPRSSGPDRIPDPADMH